MPCFNRCGLLASIGSSTGQSSGHHRIDVGRQTRLLAGERYAYSNFGYACSGRVIERVTGQSYEQYVRENCWRH